MRRITEPELGFYDCLADRINGLLGDPACSFTQSSLANRIGWHRSSLCNFLNRTDKTIPAHFIPPIAQALRQSIEVLMSRGAAPSACSARNSWDPRNDDAEILIEKLREWRDRCLPGIQLHGHLPPSLLSRRGMITNYVQAIFDGSFHAAAERWHDVIDAQVELVAGGGQRDVLNLIFYSDLLRLPNREYPFQNFSDYEVVCVLETLKKTCVRQRDFLLIILDDTACTKDARLELASNSCIGVVGRETRIEYGNNFCVRWQDDAQAAGATHTWLRALQKGAGFGPHDRPGAQHMEQLIDRLLRRMENHCAVAAVPPRRHVA